MAENNNIPEHWEIKKLGEVCAYSKGKMPQVLKKDKSKECTIPYINIKAFEKGIFAEYTDGVKCNLCNDGDLLMVWDGARCGMIGKAKKGAVGSTLMKILPTENIHKEYLYYFINSKYQTLNTKPKGVGIPHIEPTLLWNFELIVPSLTEQQAIVSKIEELLSALENGKQQLQNTRQQLKVYRQSLLKWAFEGKLTRLNHDPSDLHDEHDLKMAAESQIEYIKNQGSDNLPEGWKWVTVKDICMKIVGGGTPSTKVNRYWNGDIPWISSADIYGIKDIKPRRKITNEAVENSAANLLPKGGIIVVTRVGLGKLAIAPFDLCFSQDSQGLVLNEYYILKEYALWVLTRYVQIFKHQSRGTTINGVTKKQLADLAFPLPPIEEQQLIVEELESKLTVCDKIEETISHSLQQAETLWQSILKKAFEGRLV